MILSDNMQKLLLRFVMDVLHNSHNLHLHQTWTEDNMQHFLDHQKNEMYDAENSKIHR